MPKPGKSQKTGMVDYTTAKQRRSKYAEIPSLWVFLNVHYAVTTQNEALGPAASAPLGSQ